MPAAAHLDGHYGLSGLYMGVPVVLGSQGVERIVELEIDETGAAKLQASAEAIHADILTLKEKGLL